MGAEPPYFLERYIAGGGKDLYAEWLEDHDPAIEDRIDAYVTRMAMGNFGSSRSVGDGVFELKINWGPGFRVYYLFDTENVIVLLGGGDKSSQVKDILLAKKHADNYYRRRQ